MSAFALSLLAQGCNSSGNAGDKQQVIQNVPTVNIAPDSLELTGNAKLDSLLRLAATAKPDTNLAKLYYKIGRLFIADNNSQKANEYYFKLNELSKNLKWTDGYYLFSIGHADILNTEGFTDSAMVINQKALELAKQEMNEKWIAILLSSIGTSYNNKQWFETSLKYYNEALPLFEKQGEKFKVAHIYDMMGIVYYYLNMKDEAVQYYEKALKIYNEKPDTLGRISVLINYSISLMGKREYEKAEKLMLEAQRICKHNNNKYFSGPIYNNLGDLALRKYDLNNAEAYSRKALEFNLEFSNTEGNCLANINLGTIEKYKGNFNKSEKYVRLALDTAIKFDFPVEKKDCYTLLSDLAIARHDFQNHNFFKAKADSIEDEVVSEKTQRYAKEMEAKYETEKKELKISALEKERQLVIGLSIAGGAVLLLALATFILLWRWMIQKKRVVEKQKQLAEQQVIQLEQEKQLVATQAVLEGETRERSRLARDLHDGLGSMLTGVKLNLLELKKGATLDFAEVERFDNAVNLLDESISEMRRVAHHLMPDTLSRFGLKSAVGDFCKTIPSIHFSYYGDESRLNPELEAIAYRCIYELVNNALKYAGAQKILVQIMQRPDSIAFTVQDDGCGFDPSVSTDGTGLQNIRTRVAAYNGIMNIDSKAGEGTEINVELGIRN